MARMALSTSPPCSASWWSAESAALRSGPAPSTARSNACRTKLAASPGAARVATGTATRATMLFFAMRRE